MKRQLVLLEATPELWRLDEHTREIGRRGVARARQALREADPAAPTAEAADDRRTPAVRKPAA